jgi:4-hydroxybenzoate polyprenyltransferase
MLGGPIDALFIVLTVFFLIPYNLLMYGINDVNDYESDMRNPRKNSIEGAFEQKEFHPTILKAAYGSTVVSLVAISVIVLMKSDLAISTVLSTFAVLAIVIFFVIAYSAKHLRFKEVPFLDSFTSSIHFVGPMLVAMALFGFPVEIWPYAIALFLWGLASHAFGAVQDVIPDREGGIKSIATVIGARATVWFSGILYTAAIVLMAVQGGLGLIVAGAGLIYVLNVAPYLRITDKTSEKAHGGWRRFIWLNYIVGAVVTICLILAYRIG